MAQAKANDVDLALGALGAPAMPYRSFAADTPVPAGDIADAATAFPLLAAALPVSGEPVALPPRPTAPAPVTAVAVPPPSPPSPPMRSVPAAWPQPVRPAQQKPSVTPLATMFGRLRGETEPAAAPAREGRDLRDLFRTL